MLSPMELGDKSYLCYSICKTSLIRSYVPMKAPVNERVRLPWQAPTQELLQPGAGGPIPELIPKSAASNPTY